MTATLSFGPVYASGSGGNSPLGAEIQGAKSATKPKQSATKLEFSVRHCNAKKSHGCTRVWD
jgi:hypothetical protein